VIGARASAEKFPGEATKKIPKNSIINIKPLPEEANGKKNEK